MPGPAQLERKEHTMEHTRKQSIRFGVLADLHVDIMPDTQRRLDIFLKDCQEHDVDFIMELGDFCYPDDNRFVTCKEENMPVNIANGLRTKPWVDKRAIVKAWQEFPKPAYHVIGNHDTDMCAKRDICAFHGGHDCYYSFDCGQTHFIVLDANYFRRDGEEVSYDHGNYFDAAKGDFPIIPKEQLDWLKADLAKTNYPSILFSHQSLAHDPRGIRNHKELHEILKNAPSGVILCMNGHEHIDAYSEEDGIAYVMLNSISNQWLGEQYAAQRYEDEIEAKCPDVRYTAPYRDPVYAIVTVQEDCVRIQGVSSELIPPLPQELGYPAPVTAKVTSRIIPIRKR